MRISHIVVVLAATLLMTSQTVSLATHCWTRPGEPTGIPPPGRGPWQLRERQLAGRWSIMGLGGSNVFDGPSDQASVDAMKTWAITPCARLQVRT